MRTRFVASVMVLGSLASVPVSAAHRPSDDEKKIVRIMALAERDLELRRTDLGLVGSTLATPNPAQAVLGPGPAVLSVSRVQATPRSSEPAAFEEEPASVFEKDAVPGSLQR